MKMKLNKKSLMMIISAIVLVALLIGVIVFLNMNKEKENNDSNNNSGTKQEEQSKYSCKLQLDDTETATTYLLETYEVKDGRILSASHDILIETKTDSYYNSLKAIEEYAKGKTFDDKDKTITFKNSEDTDYTKTSDGQELNLKYDEYIKELEQNNYICK